MTASDLRTIFRRHQHPSGIVGVAFGRKEANGRQAATDAVAVSFFVQRKEPRRGARQRLESGRLALPGSIRIGGERLVTDVVETRATPSHPTKKRTQREMFTAGGPIGNRLELGTFGCLVNLRGSSHLHALTNRHVALSTGTIVGFPDLRDGAIAGVTGKTLEFVPDEDFLPFIDRPRSYFDVDAAIVRIPDRSRNRFSPRLPTIGTPNAVFEPIKTSSDAYLQSLLNKPVASWSWTSGRKEGYISHVLYITDLPRYGGEAIYSFLVHTPGTTPSSERDSGKVWISTSEPGSIQLVGLHQGSVPLGGSGLRFAAATELSATMGLMRLSPSID